jgi:hypothetical protein
MRLQAHRTQGCRGGLDLRWESVSPPTPFCIAQASFWSILTADSLMEHWEPTRARLGAGFDSAARPLTAEILELSTGL